MNNASKGPDVKRPGLLLLFVLFAGAVLPAGCPSRTAGVSAPSPPGAKTDFIRFVEEAPFTGHLDTAIVSYENEEGVRVDLVGAVHLADPGFYSMLQTLFAFYDAVLYEMIIPEGARPPGKGNRRRENNLVSNVQRNLCRLMSLEFQLDAVDYARPNFVHADLTTGEFLETWRNRGESFWTLFSRILNTEVSALGKGFGKDMTGPALLDALRSPERAARLKFLIAKEFGGIETLFAGGGSGVAGGNSMLVGERNKAVIRVLKREIEAGKKKLAVFFGVGHMPDLENRLLQELGFHRKWRRWVTAWEIQGAAEEASPLAHGDAMRESLHKESFPLVIDTDMGLDDVRTLFALLGGKGCSIPLIVTVAGSASLGRATDHALSLLEALGVEDVPVCRGASLPGLSPPPWRPVADALGGAAFPPPRRIEARDGAPEVLDRIVADHDGAIRYLALGPLRNPADLERAHPGTLAHLDSLWIPVDSLAKGKVRAWNLAADPDSTAAVIRAARRIILVDVSSAGKIDARKLFEEAAKEPSPAGQWIARFLKEAGAAGPHLAIYDELAAAALSDPSVIRIGEDSYRFVAAVKEGIEVEPAAAGNIKVARIVDPRAALGVLEECWKRKRFSSGAAVSEAGGGREPGHEHEHEHGGAQGPSIAPRDLIRTFHGHLGPYVVLGFRMGRLALKVTGAEGHFDVSAQVHSHLAPPPSCLIDGVQLGSGCTLGKRNITVEETEGPAWAVFEASDGKKVTIRLRPEIPGLVAKLAAEKGVEPAGDFIFAAKTDTLFEWTVKDAGRDL